MRKWLRLLYRLLIQNVVIRFIWMLSLAVWGVKWATNTLLADKNTYFAKTIYKVSPDDISALTIRKDDTDMVLVHTETGWLAVQNNVIVPVAADSVALYLTLLKKLESHSIIKLPDFESTETVSETDSKNSELVVIINRKDNQKDSLSIFYTKKDTLSGNTYTYIQKNDERLLHGVKTDFYTIFNRDFEAFRNKKLMSFNKADIVKMTFQNTTDTISFYAQDTNRWICSGKQYAVLQDSLNQYIQNINRLLPITTPKGKSIFYDGERDFINSQNIDNQLIIHTVNDSIILSTYRRENTFLLQSSHNKDNFFRIDSAHTVIKKPTLFLKKS